jgi:transcriptional regulator with XRE-family HTH domain
MPNQLQRFRVAQGFKKRVDLAAGAKVSERTIANLEEGSDRPVSRKVREKLCEALMVDDELSLFTFKHKVRR